jgi:hypothetical protein
VRWRFAKLAPAKSKKQPSRNQDFIKKTVEEIVPLENSLLYIVSDPSWWEMELLKWMQVC